jgi:hypothetical protein
VLPRADSLGLVLVVALDERSHCTPDAHRRDAFKDAALASAGVPVPRMTAAR